jgi:hypothetical protein
MAVRFLTCLKSGSRILGWVRKAKTNRVAQMSWACKNEETGWVIHKTKKKCVFVSKCVFHFKPTASPSTSINPLLRFKTRVSFLTLLFQPFFFKMMHRSSVIL